MKPDRIYCSGPLFCAEEVGGMNAVDLKKAIAHGKRISSILEHLPDSVGTMKWPEEVLAAVISVFDDEQLEFPKQADSGAEL